MKKTSKLKTTTKKKRNKYNKLFFHSMTIDDKMKERRTI